VCNTAEHRIEVFSKTGRPLSRFVHRVSGPDGAAVDGNPVALAFDRSGRLLVIDRRASYVDVLDRRGRPVTRLSIPAGHAAAVAVAGDGTIYVGTNAEASRVHRFRPDYTPDGAWGDEGVAPGYLKDVSAMCALGDSAVAVACERTDLVVQVFSPAGEYRRGFHTKSGTATSPFLGDGGHRRRTIWVGRDPEDPRCSTRRVRGQGRRKRDPARFLSPSSLASDGRGLIALTDEA
jgi:sugar lactone lactonase YvrE